MYLLVNLTGLKEKTGNSSLCSFSFHLKQSNRKGFLVSQLAPLHQTLKQEDMLVCDISRTQFLGLLLWEVVFSNQQVHHHNP